MWHRALATLQAEFSSASDVEQITRMATRLLLAAVLGGALGWQREQEGKSAGLRTHMLVAMGCALFVLVPQQAGVALGDLSRVVQGIVAGVGFLGAGAIVKSGSRERVRGLTTAAGVWTTAAIGTACGLGLETTALLAAAFALVVLALLPRLVDRPAADADDPPR